MNLKFMEPKFLGRVNKKMIFFCSLPWKKTLFLGKTVIDNGKKYM